MDTILRMARPCGLAALAVLATAGFAASEPVDISGTWSCGEQGRAAASFALRAGSGDLVVENHTTRAQYSGRATRTWARRVHEVSYYLAMRAQQIIVITASDSNPNVVKLSLPDVWPPDLPCWRVSW